MRMTLMLAVQLITMLSDLMIIAAVLIAARFAGPIGLLLGLALVWGPTKSTGGLFYAWRPSVIKTVWANWKHMTGVANAA